MADLTKPQQRWIVIRLASYDPISLVVSAFAEQFPGKATTRQQVWEYDCSKGANRAKRSPDLVALFDETRDDFKAATEDVLISTKAGRLLEYQRIFDDAKTQKLRKMQLAILEQVAKEMGDVYTNRRDLTSNGQAFKALFGIDLDAI